MNSAFLLSVSTGPFWENYKRFYFQDIKSLILLETETWKIWNWIFGLLAVCSGLIILTTGGKGLLFTVLVLAIILVALAVNIIRGPSCTCYIETAVQKEKLVPLNRLKKAQKVMDTLKPKILEVQRKIK